MENEKFNESKIHYRVKNNIMACLKSGDKVRLEVMRGIATAFTNELTATGHTPQDILADEQALAVISRLAKQRKDSIEQFTKGGRMDLVAEEVAQLDILSEFLPKMMELSEVETFVKNKIAEAGAVDTSKKGMFMATLMKDLKGKADGSTVKEVVDKLFV